MLETGKKNVKGNKQSPFELQNLIIKIFLFGRIAKLWPPEKLFCPLWKHCLVATLFWFLTVVRSRMLKRNNAHVIQRERIIVVVCGMVANHISECCRWSNSYNGNIRSFTLTFVVKLFQLTPTALFYVLKVASLPSIIKSLLIAISKMSFSNSRMYHVYGHSRLILSYHTCLCTNRL